jgi:YD repeat-containing protein
MPWGCLSWGGGTGQVPIDPNGNLLSKVDGADTWGYEWNARNELIRVTKNTLEVARFAYDPKGRRVEKVAGGVTPITPMLARTSCVRSVAVQPTGTYTDQRSTNPSRPTTGWRLPTSTPMLSGAS